MEICRDDTSEFIDEPIDEPADEPDEDTEPPARSEQLRLGEDFPRPEDYEDERSRDIRRRYYAAKTARTEYQKIQKAYKNYSLYLAQMFVIEDARIRSAACPGDIVLAADTFAELKVFHPETLGELPPETRARMIVYAAFLDGAPMDIEAARKELKL